MVSTFVCLFVCFHHSKYEEHRAASLESKLSELSDTVGKYDRQRENDLAAIL